MIINCIQCNKEHTACRKTQRFCSQVCCKTWQYAHGLKANTKEANKSVRKNGQPKRKGKPALWIGREDEASIRKKISKSKTGKVVQKLRGKNHWNWQGGKESNWGTPEYKAWRKAVMSRDNFTCQHCGDNRGGNLEADHTKPRCLFPELTFDIDNGRTLCQDCHKQTRTWGYKVKSLTRADFGL